MNNFDNNAKDRPASQAFALFQRIVPDRYIIWRRENPEFTILILFAVNIIIVYGTWWYVNFESDEYCLSIYKPHYCSIRGPFDRIPLSCAYGHDPRSRNPPPLFFNSLDPESLVRELLRNTIAGLAIIPLTPEGEVLGRGRLYLIDIDAMPSSIVQDPQNRPLRYVAVYPAEALGAPITVDSPSLRELVNPHSSWTPQTGGRFWSVKRMLTKLVS